MPHASNIVTSIIIMLVGTLPSLHLQLRTLVTKVPWGITPILVANDNNCTIVAKTWATRTI